jgi:hypothetical protein
MPHGLNSMRVGEQTEMTAQSVNGWVKRFEADGIKGVRTRPGQGRKPIFAYCFLLVYFVAAVIILKN